MEENKITNLISHSSGIPEFYESNNTYLPTKEIVKQIKDKPLIFLNPGQKNNTRDSRISWYYLISSKKIYNKPFTRILHDEVIIPLGMTDGGFDMEYKSRWKVSKDRFDKRKSDYLLRRCR